MVPASCPALAMSSMRCFWCTWYSLLRRRIMCGLVVIVAAEVCMCAVADYSIIRELKFSPGTRAPWHSAVLALGQQRRRNRRLEPTPL